MPENNIQETQEVVVPVQQEVVPVQEEKKGGLTTGQKIAGGTVIGFAIGGIVWLILSIIKGIKWLANKAKEKFKPEPAKTTAEQPASEAPAEPEKEAEQPTPEQK